MDTELDIPILEEFTVMFPDGKEYKLMGFIEGNKIFNGDGEMMFEVNE